MENIWPYIFYQIYLSSKYSFIKSDKINSDISDEYEVELVVKVSSIKSS